MQTVVVTGANGFIGRALLHELCLRDVIVYAVTRKPELFTRGGAKKK